jgi:hypothetical protein
MIQCGTGSDAAGADVQAGSSVPDKYWLFDIASLYNLTPNHRLDTSRLIDFNAFFYVG